ncbi:carboxypeptidase regulatory-like domain-containing protein [bacterium]|nr:carboxypeptidase regulatory-like domain-containing protein [bacterium]
MDRSAGAPTDGRRAAPRIAAAGGAALLLCAGAARAAVVTGTVVGDGAVPIGGALVEVLRPAGEPPCATRSAADGSFALTCEATGTYALRASSGGLQPWRIEAVELAPDRALQLNFLLRADAPPAAAAVPPVTAARAEPDGSPLMQPLANPLLAVVHGRPVSLRHAGAALAALAFVLGAAVIVSVGRHLRRTSGPLAAAEAADLVVNARRRLGQRLSPVAAGARGAHADVSYGAEEIAALLAQRRYGVLGACLLAPLLFAAAATGFAVALLVGQPLYLLLAMLLVPIGFLVTPLVILIQARRLLAAAPPIA